MCIATATAPRTRPVDRPRNPSEYEALLTALYKANDAASDATAADGPGSELLQPEDRAGIMWAVAHCLALVESSLIPCPAMR
jgi:hypothetical protein